MRRRFAESVAALVVVAVVASLSPTAFAGTTETTLRASDSEPGDLFGWSVSRSGNYAIVGALWEDGGEGNSILNAGAAYIYEKSSSGTWRQKAILHASDMQAFDEFGISVSISGNYAIVGAQYEDGGPGDPCSNAGAAYIFERNSLGKWVQKAILHATSGVGEDENFGISVSISGSYAIVGTYSYGPKASTVYVFRRTSSGAWVPDGSVTKPGEGAFGLSVSLNGSYFIAGAPYDDLAYIYKRNSSGVWQQQVTLLGSGRHEFGLAVSIYGAYAIVGARDYPCSVYEKNSSGVWKHKAYLLPSDWVPGDEFGYAVSINAGYAAVGAYAKDTVAGAAYVFRRNSAGTWVEYSQLVASDAQEYDQFGTSVDINGAGQVIVGAMLEDGGDGDPIENSGSAYIYD